MDEPVFKEFPKIPRLNRDIVITEKIDGTNAQIYIDDDLIVHAGSRNRWLFPEKSYDHFGFARWVKEHERELLNLLGAGRHYGEWWGKGIQRGYGQKDKKFSLFNSERWKDIDTDFGLHVVPELFRGDMDTAWVKYIIHKLQSDGSVAAPGFMDPEGIVIFHTAAQSLFKVTIEDDEKPKGKE